MNFFLESIDFLIYLLDPMDFFWFAGLNERFLVKETFFGPIIYSEPINYF